MAGVVAVPSLVLWIAPLVFEVINVKRPVSKLLPLALGLPWLAAALSLCILIARQWKRKE